MRVVFSSHGLGRLNERSTLAPAAAIRQSREALRGERYEVWFDDGKRNLCVRLGDGCWAVLRSGHKPDEYVVVTVLTASQLRYNRNRWWSKTAEGSTRATSDGFWKPFAQAFAKEHK